MDKNNENTEKTEEVGQIAGSESVNPEIELQEQNSVEESSQFIPNTKYTVNGQEFEFDERIKSSIKNKEDEDWFREVFEKSSAFDDKKTKLNKTRERYDSLNQEFNAYKNEIEPLIEMKNRGDYKNLIKAIGIDGQTIIQLAQDQIAYNQLTSEQKAQYNRIEQASFDHYEIEKVNRNYEQRIAELEARENKSLVLSELNRPESREAINSFDQRNGKDAFFNEVVKRGAFYEKVHGIVKEPSSLVDEVLQILNISTPQSPTASKNSNLDNIVEKPPVIPNTGQSGSGSPVKRTPRSLDELKELAKGLSD